MSDRVVARLCYPVPARDMDRMIQGLEEMYGEGLVIIFDGEDFDPDWLTIVRPQQPEQE